MTARLAVSVASILLCVAAAPAGAGTARCTGDCDGGKSVEIGELIRMVNIALGLQDLSACDAGDGDRSGAIEINELILAVRHALEGCSGDVEPLPFKHSIEHPFDPYLASPTVFDGPYWVKFTIRVDEPGLVYFQKSGETPLHHDFITTTLGGYIGWTPAEIDAVSLHAENQELVLGAVLYSPMAPREIAIQLVRQDPYTVDEVERYFEAVRGSIEVENGVPFFYFPTFEQQESAEESSSELEARGIRLGSTARWQLGNTCYTAGWAYGRVVYVEGESIEDAYEAGTLKPDDILLTDGVPAEIPFVSAVLTLSPSTPSSHVAILAADWEIPFAHLSQADTAELAQSLVGKNVVVRATTLSGRYFGPNFVDPSLCQIDLVDVTDTLEAEVRDKLLDLKRAPDLDIRPFVLSGSYSAAVGTATPADIVRIGGKAANYGFLLRAIPEVTRPAIAFTFDLWNDYLDQTVGGGPSLREQIADLLAPFPTFPPANFEELYDALDDARDLIDDEADFNEAQRSAIIAALAPFDAMRQIRFRSSTNVEDSDVFTGAGLYESESGCLADDLDDDDEGPSLCDSTRNSERGVFRALRKVFQSFYNDNAYVERLRHRVDETKVGMAVLVHHSFPDETELANGVATVSTLALPSADVSIVSQPGANSVTNPEQGGVPEIVEVFVAGQNLYPNVRQGSDLLPLGSTVLDLPDEYAELAGYLLEVAATFGQYHGETAFDIEFEYKKITGGEGLVVKQVRRLPRKRGAEDQPPILIHQPIELCTFQGEYNDVFANYRLKTRWQPVLRNGEVHEDGGTIFVDGAHEFIVGSSVQTLDGSPAAWNGATHETFEPTIDGMLGLRDSWVVGTASERRTHTLDVYLPLHQGPGRLPIILPGDLGYVLKANWDVAVPYIDFDGSVLSRRDDVVQLHRCLDAEPLSERHILVERSFEDVSKVEVAPGFYWPPFPVGAVAGYTAPLDRWISTAIDGITSRPIMLRGYFSQSYRPEHHNFSENFIFDPHLEPGIDGDLLAEWDALGIQALVIPQSFFTSSRMRVVTHEGEITDLDEGLSR